MTSEQDNSYDIKKPQIPDSWNERKICYAHKEQRWWVSTAGSRKCGVCHPPACEDIIDRWEEAEFLSLPSWKIRNEISII